ncbi:MAG TPA: hypothetical protein VKY57_10615 [Chitinispirillaceae bacterium]|nr:hypothetical protein [Chitinispirillaceae bacterium]
MSCFLCYDIRGIQNFIFKIPKLKYVIGGSALIDNFDKTIPGIHIEGVEHIYSAGGKGAFNCKTDDIAEMLKGEIIKKAHSIGLDIRFGIGSKFVETANKVNELYPYIPSNLNGEPCCISGLYPVESGKEHAIVKKRCYKRGCASDDGIWRRFDELFCLKQNQNFFYDVSSDTEEGRKGEKALGGKRWAIICMDGNDIGAQFRKKIKESKNENDLINWIKEMSVALGKCTLEATKAGTKKVIEKWEGNVKPKFDNDNIVLPIRPIVVGGDDIIVLCNVLYASDFIKEACKKFRDESKMLHKNAKIPLWIATNGELSLSAGVLYCPVNLPLHSAIIYTEKLLANAKKAGRIFKEENNTPPEMIDWEQITETVLDTPEARRKRELYFYDEDLKKYIELTIRPYTIDNYIKIENHSNVYSKIPATIRYSVLPAMQKGHNDRLAYVAQLRKNHPELAKDLWEYDEKEKDSRWKTVNGVKRTDVIDALLILEEKERMKGVN